MAAAYASVARGADAYFKYVNARGGVNGRRIVYKYLDDAYNPANTVQQTRKLVQEDKVFAVYNSLGTEHNLATRQFLNQLKVPQVFVATGATTFSADYKRYPWTIGYQPSYVAEGRIYGREIGRLGRNKKVAVFYQDDDYGKEVLAGVRQGLRFAGRGGQVVGTAGYAVTDTDISSQITRLKGSGANVIVIAATPAPAIRAYIAINKLGWRPQVIVNSVASASNTMKSRRRRAAGSRRGRSRSASSRTRPTRAGGATPAGGSTVGSCRSTARGATPRMSTTSTRWRRRTRSSRR